MEGFGAAIWLPILPTRSENWLHGDLGTDRRLTRIRPFSSAGLAAHTQKVPGSSLDATLQEQMMQMGRKDYRTWRGKVRVLSQQGCKQFPYKFVNRDCYLSFHLGRSASS